MIDYLTAGSALLLGTFYLSQSTFDYISTLDISQLNFDNIITEINNAPTALTGAIGSSIIAVTCLGLCWVWEYGYSYLFWHSLWHGFSALTVYFVGVGHQ